MDLWQWIRSKEEREGGVGEKIAAQLKKYLSLYGEVEIKDYELLASLGYKGSNTHQGYYTYDETWLMLNGSQVVLIYSSYDEEYHRYLRGEIDYD